MARTQVREVAVADCTMHWPTSGMPAVVDFRVMVLEAGVVENPAPNSVTTPPPTVPRAVGDIDVTMNRRSRVGADGATAAVPNGCRTTETCPAPLLSAADPTSDLEPRDTVHVIVAVPLGPATMDG